MKSKLLLLIALACLVKAASAQNPTLMPPPDKDPSVGEWLKNFEKSKPVKGRDCTFVESHLSETVVREGDELVITERGGPSKWVCPGGDKYNKSYEFKYRFRCDGNFHPEAHSSTTCKYVAPNILEGETTYKRANVMLHRQGTIYWKTEISADGTQMTDAQYDDAGMTKLLNLTVWEKSK